MLIIIDMKNENDTHSHNNLAQRLQNCILYYIKMNDIITISTAIKATKEIREFEVKIKRHLLTYFVTMIAMNMYTSVLIFCNFVDNMMFDMMKDFLNG